MHAVVRRCSGAASDGERAGAGARRDWADEAARDAQRELVAMPSTDERIGDGRTNESERQGAEGSDGARPFARRRRARRRRPSYRWHQARRAAPVPVASRAACVHAGSACRASRADGRLGESREESGERTQHMILALARSRRCVGKGAFGERIVRRRSASGERRTSRPGTGS